MPDFTSKRKEWISWFDLGNPWSILSRLYSQIYNEVAFRTFNEGRRIQTENSNNCITFVDEMIFFGFVAGQLLTIRQLTETNSNHPEKGVVSIIRFLDDAMDNLSLFSRESFVTMDGDPYDYEGFKEDWRSEIAKKAFDSPDKTYTGCGSIPKWVQSERKHECFDELSKTNPKCRKRVDHISPKTINALRGQLGPCFKLIDYTNKKIAHNPDEFSLSKVRAKSLTLTINKIREANHSLAKVIRYCYGKILWVGSGPIFPTPQFNFFQNVEKPLFQNEYLPDIKRFYDEFVKEIEKE